MPVGTIGLDSDGVTVVGVQILWDWKFDTARLRLQS